MNIKQTQAKILKIVGQIDPSGYNTKYYEDLFKRLTDANFVKWMKQLRDNKNAKIKIFIPPFKVVLDIEDSIKAAEELGVKIRERVRLWDAPGQRYCMTPEAYFILKLPVRRLKQYLYDGLSVPDSDRRLNPLTNQVVKPDKGSAISYPQLQMIMEKDLPVAANELITVRGGDLEAYGVFTRQLEETGHANVSEAMSDSGGVKTAQTFKTLLQAAHLDSNV